MKIRFGEQAIVLQCICVVLVALACPAAASAATYYVSPSGTGTAPYSNCATGFTTIQAGVAAAAAGDTVRVCAGLYSPVNGIGIRVDDLTIEGDSAATTIIDGASVSSSDAMLGLSFPDADNATFRNLTIRNHEVTSGSAAGIYAYDGGNPAGGADLTIEHCVFSGLRTTGSSSDGAAFGARTAVVRDSTFTGNRAAERGGAIFTFSPRTDSLVIHRSTFTGNQADGGNGIGGAAATLGGLLVVDSTFDGNSATSRGGALFADGSADVTSSTLTGNEVDDTDASPRPVNDSWQGGAIWAGSDVALSRSDVSRNAVRLSGEGAGAANLGGLAGGGVYAAGDVNARDTTIAGNGIFASEHGAAGDMTARGGGLFARSKIVAISSTLTGNLITLTAPSVLGNVIAAGGGAYFGTQLIIDDTSITANAVRSDTNAVVYFALAWGGGAASETASSTASLRNSTLADNSIATSDSAVPYTRGGGLRVGQSATLDGSTVSGNQSPYHGGGISAESASADHATEVIARNSTFSGNTAQFGSAIYAKGHVGISSTAPSHVTLVNATVADNRALTAGAVTAEAGSLEMTNTIMSDEGGCRWDIGSATGQGGNAINDSSGSCRAFGATPLGFSATSAQLALSPLADNGGPTKTMALAAGSAAIDAAVPAQCPAADQRGVARPAGTCDSGAYQFGAPTPTPSTTPIPGTTPTPARPRTPSNRFTLLPTTATASRLQSTLVFSDPGVATQRGTFSALSDLRSGKRLVACTGTRKIAKAGRYVIACRLTAAARSARSRGPIRITLVTSFRPTGGTARSVRRTVTLKQTSSGVTN